LGAVKRAEEQITYEVAEAADCSLLNPNENESVVFNKKK